jgi:hypothetical protein
MRKVGAIVFVAVLLVVGAVLPSYAGGRGGHGGHRGGHGGHGGHSRHAGHGHHHHGHFHGSAFYFGVGPSYWWGSPYWWGPPAYAPWPAYSYTYTPRPVIVQQPQPQVYVQQAPANGALEPGYWYYCQSAGAYYPTAPSCAEPWVKVPPK